MIKAFHFLQITRHHHIKSGLLKRAIRHCVLPCLLIVMLAPTVVRANRQPSVMQEWLRDTEFAGAWQLYLAGQHTDAYAAFQELFRTDPANISYNFALGMSAREAGRPANAAMAFERILMREPHNDRVRLELALTYHRMGQPELAKNYAQEVLQRNPPAEVRQNVETLLRQIERSQSRVNWDAQATIGFLYDSNPNTGSDHDFIQIAPIRFGPLLFDRLQVMDRSKPQETWGMLVSGYIQGKYDIGVPGAWRAIGLALVSQSILEDAHDFDTTVLRALAGLQYLRGRTMTQIPLRYDRVLLRRNDFVQTLHTGVTHVRPLQNTVFWTSSAQIEGRDYFRNRNRDNIRFALNQGLRHLLTDHIIISGGVTGFQEWARKDIYSNIGVEPFTSIRWRPDRRNTLSCRLQYRHTWYDEREPLAPEDREDKQWQVRLEAQRTIRENYAVSLTYQYSENDSTFDLYDYTRHLVNLNLSRRF